MPELPEVESLRKSLEPHIVNQVINEVTVLKPKLVSAHGTKRTEDQAKVTLFQKSLIGRKITSITRKIKNLLLHLDDGSVVLIHLKMTGQLVWQDKSLNQISGGHPIQNLGLLPNKHSHIIFKLSDGTLFYNDVRMFGYLLYFESLKELEVQGFFQDTQSIDPQNDEYDLVMFKNAIGNLAGTVKQNFLNNRGVVGLGNIYSDETCFEAGVRPTRTNKSLKPKEVEKLYQAVKKIIPKAIQEGGSSVANYLLADGSKGNYAFFHNVYNRAGKECKICGTILQKITHSSRTTVFCFKCQK